MKNMENRKSDKYRHHGFSLLELLIVIAILGVLVTLVLPGFSGAQEDAKEKVARAEMHEIQSAFRRFAADVGLENNVFRLKDICNYGLWPLLQERHPRTTDIVTYGVDETTGAGPGYYENYNVITGLGRRGPYLAAEGFVTIVTPTGGTYEDEPLSPGQESASEGDITTIPVVRDPYGGYYRILSPPIEGGDDTTDKKLRKYRRLVLVCTGPNRRLDTAQANIYESDGSLKVNESGEITPDNRDNGNDDLIIRLLPTAAW